jgi:hypothetical protein
MKLKIRGSLELRSRLQLRERGTRGTQGTPTTSGETNIYIYIYIYIFLGYAILSPVMQYFKRIISEFIEKSSSYLSQ